MVTLTEAAERAKSQGRTVLTEIESKQVLAAAGIPVAEARLATSADDAVSAANALGYPVVVKIVSPDITHKSDVGGVKVGLESADEVRAAVEEIIAAVKQASPTPKSTASPSRRWPPLAPRSSSA